jgi:hypothetical protein
MGKQVAGEKIKWASLSEELQEGFSDCSFEDEDDFILVEEGEWVVSGKYEYCTNIFQRKSDCKYFAQNWYRSGSYHSDYDYNAPEDLYEVERKEVVTVQWNMVK